MGREGERRWRDCFEGRRWEVAWSRTYVHGQREEVDSGVSSDCRDPAVILRCTAAAWQPRQGDICLSLSFLISTTQSH